MDYRRNPEETADMERTIKAALQYLELVPAEVFKWVAWASAIAALQVVDIRTGSPWLQWLAFVLALLLVARMQWFIYAHLGWTKHPERREADGSSVTEFRGVKLVLGFLLCVPVYLFAYGLPPVIAESDLLPPAREKTSLGIPARARDRPVLEHRPAAAAEPKAEPPDSIGTPEVAAKGSETEGSSQKKLAATEKLTRASATPAE